MTESRVQLVGLWWWIDRWRKSTAYTDMTLEEQGAYRNLIDEAHLRGGSIPNCDRILAKSCGDMRAWNRVKKTVLPRFFLGPDGGWHNETLDEILRESVRRVEKQRSYRARYAGHNGGNERGNGAGNKRGSPDPDPDPDLDLQKTRTRSADALTGFASFWSVYPKKKSRADAEKAWQKLAPLPELIQRILAAVVAQRDTRDWHKDGGRWIPYPATWLNKRCWEDDVGVSLPESPPEETRADCRHEPKCVDTFWHRHRLAQEREAS